ncbi:MAG: hypothetical protein QM820_24280 [Minicystis sp.]
MKTHHPSLAVACTAALLASARPAAADPPPAPPPPATSVQSPGLLAGGIVLSVAGGAAMTLGLVRILATETCPDACSNPKGNEVIGGVVLGAGAAVLAGGIVMVVFGSRKAPGGTTVSNAPAWVGQPGGAGWRWRF